MADENGDEIFCEGIGAPVFVDRKDNKFFTSYRTENLAVKLGDFVRIGLGDNKCGFGQVLAVYEDDKEEMFIEVRWFQEQHDLHSCPKLKEIKVLPNELFECEDTDDIPAGSVLETITVRDSTAMSHSGHNSFVCRFSYQENGQGPNTLSTINFRTIFQRAMHQSEYKNAYSAYLEMYDYNHQSDPYSVAIQRLHLSVIPENLPCRAQERAAVQDFIRRGVTEGGAKKPMYICGTPGTGKTATVMACIAELQKEADRGEIPEFGYVEINCLRLKAPVDAYTQLWRGISGLHDYPKKALKHLKSRFNDTFGNDYIVHRNSSSSSGQVRPEKVYVILLDELDFLVTRSYDVIYDFFNWPNLDRANIVVISIANTMNLISEMHSKIASRAGLHLNRIVYAPYTHDQIQEILEDRLKELKLDAFTPLTRKLIARKAAGVAGDLRAALKICQHVIELYRDHRDQKVAVAALAADKANPMAKFNVVGKQSGGISTSSSSSAAIQTSAPTSSPEEAEALKKLVIGFIAEAMDGYKQTSFIGPVSSLSSLEKALLLLMVKVRRDNSGLEGDDGVIECDRGIDLTELLERLDTLCGIIKNQRSEVTDKKRLRAGTLKNDEAEAKRAVLASQYSFLEEVPSPWIVERALASLCSLKVIALSQPRVGHGGAVHYVLHSSFLYSDLLAALKDHPLLMFCTSNRHM